MRNRLTKYLKLASKILMVISTFVFGISIVAGTIMLENVDQVNTVIGDQTQIIEQLSGNENMDKEYYKSAFTSVKEVKANGAVYAETIVAEGACLLKNGSLKDGSNGEKVLPLKKDMGVSLFSTSSVNLITAGTGSSGTSETPVSLMVGLQAAGLRVNENLYDWYDGNYGTYGRKNLNGAVIGASWSIGDVRWDQIGTNAKTDATYGDAAIFVLSRSGGEGLDLAMEPSPKSGALENYTDGNYLKLSPTERNVLENLKLQKDNGVFKRIIVLLNSANQVQCDFVDDETLGIDAFMWIGTYGTVGAYAVGDLLAGNVNPSGRLSSVFWKEHWRNPVHANYGPLVFDPKGSPQYVGQDVRTSKVSDGKHIVYQENIYMGYRYTETRYEDKVMNRGNVGEFVYDDVVSYPFGYGLSYSQYNYSNMTVEKVYKSAANQLKDNVYNISVTVTNSGTAAGKEVVQVYLQKPFTTYDITNKIEKPAVELVGFAKTKVLDPGASETVKIVVNERDFASYDAHGAGTYIVDGGTYYFAVGKDAHDATNNILAAKNKSIADGMTANGNAALTHAVTMAFDAETYSTAAATGNEIVNRFDESDLKIYSGAGDNATSFDYVSRTNWDNTVKFGLDANDNRLNNHVKVVGTQKMQEDLNASRRTTVDPDPVGEDNTYPTYGSKATSRLLIDLRAYGDDDNDPTNDIKMPYDHEWWDDLLDQLTWDEIADLLSHGFRKTAPLESIVKFETIDHNGATGPVQPYNEAEKSGVNRGYAVRTNDPDKNQRPVVYPCNGIVAATFNLELADYYGRQWGEDCLWAGYSGLYGMGMNTHRSPYGGRNFEYYSEDPVLMGKIAAATTKGLTTRGVYVYMKHCFLNDQETYRCGGWTWATEQSIREIYLRSFQIAIEEGGATSVMGGLNSIGMKWTGTHGFMNTVLRGEYGMTGHTVTDSIWWYNGSFAQAIIHGNDLVDGSSNPKDWDYARPERATAEKSYSKLAWAMRESAHRLLYTVVHSNAMNDISANTRIRLITPKWVYTVQGLQTGAGVLFGVSIAFLLTMVFLVDVWGVLIFKKKKEVSDEKII